VDSWVWLGATEGLRARRFNRVSTLIFMSGTKNGPGRVCWRKPDGHRSHPARANIHRLITTVTIAVM
jgi:hypothetical protein